LLGYEYITEMANRTTAYNSTNPSLDETIKRKVIMTETFPFNERKTTFVTRQRLGGKSQQQTGVSAVAWARKRNGTGWQLVLGFTDRDGRAHRVLVRRSEILQGDTLFELLDHHGYPVPADHHGRADLRRSVVAADPEQRLLIDSRGMLTSEASADDALETAVAKILDRLPSLAKGALNASTCKRAGDQKAVASASVVRVLHTDGQPLLALRPAAFKDLIGAGVSEKAVAAALEQRGMLIPRGNGRRTRELRLPGSNVRRGYYCLRLSPAKPGSGKLHRKHD
jgi:hypothetical protein